jgi:hypothetical protein
MPQFLEQRYGTRIRRLTAVFWLALYIFVNLTSIVWLGSIDRARCAPVHGSHGRRVRARAAARGRVLAAVAVARSANRIQTASVGFGTSASFNFAATGVALVLIALYSGVVVSRCCVEAAAKVLAEREGFEPSMGF